MVELDCGREPNETDVRVGRRIVQQRIERGLSTAALAHKTYLSQRRLEAYEAGALRPRPVELAAIAEALNSSIASFFTDPSASNDGPDATVSAGGRSPGRRALLTATCFAIGGSAAAAAIRDFVIANSGGFL